MNPSASTPMCSFRQSRRFFDACLVLVRVPFAATQNLQPCGIDDQVDRAVVGSGQGRHRNDLVPARECGVVRGLEVEAHQAEQRVQEPLGLAERQAEDDPQRQHGPDREVRVPPLASAKTVLRWYPRGNRILAQPDRDAAAAPEATLVLPPVPDSVLLLVLAVDSARLRCDHDVTPPISMMDWTPPPPLACSLTPIHAPTPLFRTDCVVLKSTRTNRGRTIPVSLVKWRAALIAQDLRRTAERLAALPVDARASQRGNSGIAALCLSVLHS